MWNSLPYSVRHAPRINISKEASEFEPRMFYICNPIYYRNSILFNLLDRCFHCNLIVYFPLWYIDITSWKVRAYEFSDTLQRVNRNRTKHFP